MRTITIILFFSGCAAGSPFAQIGSTTQPAVPVKVDAPVNVGAASGPFVSAPVNLSVPVADGALAKGWNFSGTFGLNIDKGAVYMPLTLTIIATIPPKVVDATVQNNLPAFDLWPLAICGGIGLAVLGLLVGAAVIVGLHRHAVTSDRLAAKRQ